MKKEIFLINLFFKLTLIKIFKNKQNLHFEAFFLVFINTVLKNCFSSLKLLKNYSENIDLSNYSQNNDSCFLLLDLLAPPPQFR